MRRDRYATLRLIDPVDPPPQMALIKLSRRRVCMYACMYVCSVVIVIQSFLSSTSFVTILSRSVSSCQSSFSVLDGEYAVLANLDILRG